jgi:ATP-binding cassette subfamily B (MDR/TAP) protein 1
MRNRSFELAGYWVIVALGCILGNCVTVWGFGMASERLNKRVRDSSFAALIRQEVAFFDKRSVGSITSQLQDDAARIHTFSGEPIRSFLIAISSLASGVVLSLVFMWPFALLAIGCIPLMGFATSLEMKQMLGEDEGSGDAGDQDELHSPGGILVETLLNIRTVAALNLQDQREKDFDRALTEAQPNFIRSCVLAGLTGGISMFIQQWINALQLWFGGWLLFTFPDQYGFNDFLISMFAILFSLFGLGAAFNGLSDRKQTEVSAGRVFYLLDRQSEIDPLSEEGKRLDGPSEFFRAPEKPKSNLNGKKSSVVRKTSDEFSC